MKEASYLSPQSFQSLQSHCPAWFRPSSSLYTTTSTPFLFFSFFFVSCIPISFTYHLAVVPWSTSDHVSFMLFRRGQPELLSVVYEAIHNLTPYNSPGTLLFHHVQKHNLGPKTVLLVPKTPFFFVFLVSLSIWNVFSPFFILKTPRYSL